VRQKDASSSFRPPSCCGEKNLRFREQCRCQVSDSEWKGHVFRDGSLLEKAREHRAREALTSSLPLGRLRTDGCFPEAIVSHEIGDFHELQVKKR
jgi:hypothetical protein